jgi:hypothetical protein
VAFRLLNLADTHPRKFLLNLLDGHNGQSAWRLLVAAKQHGKLLWTVQSEKSPARARMMPMDVRPGFKPERPPELKLFQFEKKPYQRLLGIRTQTMQIFEAEQSRSVILPSPPSGAIPVGTHPQIRTKFALSTKRPSCVAQRSLVD